MSDKLTNLEQLRSTALGAKGMIAKVAATAADAIGELGTQLGNVGALLDEINGEVV